MKRMKDYIRYYWRIGVLLAFATGYFSCTKTESLDYEKQALNKIITYEVKNSQQRLLGAIDNASNTITVLIPYYFQGDFLLGEVQLDKDARMLDATGNEILYNEGLEPLAVGDSARYIIESADGVKRTYTLLQKILPYPDTLKIAINGVAANTTLIRKPVFGRFTITGNFESTSKLARFTLTNKTTGEVHTDYMSVFSMTPAANYTMLADISPNAKAGTYSVNMEHQGRKVALPDVELFYQRPWVPMFLSSSIYAPGDTIIFAVNRQVPANDGYATVFVGLKNLYMKIGATTGNANLPAGFPQSLVNTKIPMRLLDSSGNQVKAIFPDIPAGIYLGSYTSYGNTPAGGMYYAAPEYGICFYGDFDEQTNWGNDVFIASQIYSAGGFTVRAKQ
ncbi:hypothetical protein ACLOAU_18440 [Niabella sp. CJ426]|uniref:hypothetical protein n=1 Tax=Niabella sp. CJ426 TaxID=3393740 RepID=UPI003D0750E5